MSEQQVVEALYRAQSRRMWRALYAFAGDPDVASDALAEAFARALAHRDEIRDLPAWLWRVAFRLASAELRRRGAASAPGVATSYEMLDPVPELMGALRRLSPKQRLAVVLHDYADRSTQDVARTLGCSRATVYVHLSQGRRRLRTMLEERHA